MSAFEKLSTRARDLLGEVPRLSTDDIADLMLGEIWDECLAREDFIAQMRPAMRGIVSTTASAMRMSMLNEASAAYLARPVAQPALGEGGQSISGLQDRRAPLPEPRPAERDADHPSDETQSALVGAPAPQDGQDVGDTRTRTAVPAERSADQTNGDTHGPTVGAPAPQADQGRHANPSAIVGLRNGGGQSMRASQDRRAAPTPQSLRDEVLPGWRSLVNEPLFVPETDGLTYGSATRDHWSRRLQWHHDQAKGHLDTARKERLILTALETSGAGCLNDLLNGRTS